MYILRTFVSLVYEFSFQLSGTIALLKLNYRPT